MSTEPTALFICVALALAAYLVVSSTRSARAHRREVEIARARAEDAAREAEAARLRRIELEIRFAAEAETHRDDIVAGRESWGVDDGLGHAAPRPSTGRFKRDVPAPFSADRV